jgi:hypothetical protein
LEGGLSAEARRKPSFEMQLPEPGRKNLFISFTRYLVMAGRTRESQIVHRKFRQSPVASAATPVDETKSPLRFFRKGLERSNLN